MMDLNRKWILLLACFSLFACQGTNPDEAAIVEAQNCLDKLGISNPTGAAACVAKLDGIDTPQASMLKCAAIFIKQGFSNPTRLSQVAEQMKSSGGSGSSGTANVIGLLAFTGADASTDAQGAIEFCEKSGSKGMTMLASLASVATTANGFSNVVDECAGDNPDPADCATAVKDGICNANSAELGQVAIVTYATSCQGSDITNPMCEVYKDVTNSGTDSDATSVGNKLKVYVNGGAC